jgi:hypothetical protein
MTHFVHHHQEDCINSIYVQNEDDLQYVLAQNIRAMNYLEQPYRQSSHLGSTSQSHQPTESPYTSRLKGQVSVSNRVEHHVVALTFDLEKHKVKVVASMVEKVLFALVWQILADSAMAHLA